MNVAAVLGPSSNQLRHYKEVNPSIEFSGLDRVLERAIGRKPDNCRYQVPFVV